MTKIDTATIARIAAATGTDVDTFGGPPPDPPLEWRVTSTAPAGWPRTWTPVPDARTLGNLLDMRSAGNYHGVELRPAGGVPR